RRCDELADMRGVRHVPGDCQSTRVGCDRTERFRAPAAHDDLRPFAGEPPGGRGPDPGAPAGDNRHLALEPHRPARNVVRHSLTHRRGRDERGRMANMEPLRREDHPELEELFQLYNDTLSFVPNSLYTMARRPEILRAFSELISQIWRTGTLPQYLKPL